MTKPIFVPKKIKVGFQARTDTYTKRLAYVIYYDQKGVLRKETSWESWRSKDINPQDFENVPTEGFVLNKKVGGYKSDYNYRQAYTRVYDPRGFEFEITVPNLLYILENANCIKGKGLEGKFVYGWQGTDLVLIPEQSPEYSQHINYSELVAQPFDSANLIPGCVYRTEKNEELVYLGRFRRYATSWREEEAGKSMGLYYFFSSYKNIRTLTLVKSLAGKIIEKMSYPMVEDFTERMDWLEGDSSYSPYDPTKDVYEPATVVDLAQPYYNISLYKSESDGTKIPVTYNSYDRRFSWRSQARPAPSIDRFGYQNNYFYTDSQGFYTHYSDIMSPAKLIEKYNLLVKRKFLKNGKEKR